MGMQIGSKMRPDSAKVTLGNRSRGALLGNDAWGPWQQDGVSYDRNREQWKKTWITENMHNVSCRNRCERSTLIQSLTKFLFNKQHVQAVCDLIKTEIAALLIDCLCREQMIKDLNALCSNELNYKFCNY